MKVAILNDTASNPHFGCQMVMAAYRKLLLDRGVELVGTLKHGVAWNEGGHHKLLDSADLVLVNGEGSTHHGGHRHLLSVGDRYPSMLMNCVFQSMSGVSLHLKRFKHITVRESMSADYMASTYRIKPEIVPDLVFSAHNTMPQTCSNGLDVFLSDSVVRDGIQTHSAFDSRFIERMATYRGACCGRFHAICVAAMLGVPFSAWRSSTWKNKAIMLDMGIPELYADGQGDALLLIPDKVADSVVRYVLNAAKKIDNLFDRIANGKI